MIPDPFNPVTNQHLTIPLTTARCCKSYGYRHIATGYAYCSQCYYLFHPRYHIEYEWVESHHMVCGDGFSEIICTRCDHKIMVVRPLYNCSQCTNKYLDYLLHLNDQLNNQRIEDLSSVPNPLILHIEGSQFY